MIPTCDNNKLYADNDDIKEENYKKKRKRPSCLYKECTKRPSYGMRESSLAQYCVQHKRLDDVDVKNKKCLFNGCTKQSTFGEKGSLLAEYCVEHKRPEHVDIKNKKCIFNGCTKQPSYGLETASSAEYCAEHKRPDDVNIKSKRCIFNGCKIRSSFGREGSIAEYCFNHKRPEDIDVRSRRCIFNGCTKYHSYGLKGSTAEYCTHHKRPDDVNIKSKRCIFNGCIKTPVFGKQHSYLTEYCAKHKRLDDVDIKSKKCLYNGCTKYPSFGMPNSSLREYCAEHKRLNDVNVRSKKCVHLNCFNTATFGLLFQDKIHCSKHKTHNEYAKNNPKCIIGEGLCKHLPCYTNQNNNYPLRCEYHRLEEDINVIERECQSCHLKWFLKENGLCNDCHEYIHNKVHKAKETKIKQVLEANNIEYQSWDKIPEGSCFRYRPDFVMDFGTFIIILEVDENAHRSYSCQCEIVRMINLFQDFGGLPVCFIRYNPDNYIDHLGKKQTSQAGRHNRLLNTIKSLQKHHPKDMLSIIYLYYDQDNGSNIITKIDYDNCLGESYIMEHVTEEEKIEGGDKEETQEDTRRIDKKQKI